MEVLHRERERMVNGEIIINVEGLIKKYGDYTAVNGVHFQVNKGEVFGLLGPNGAGKTTTMEMIEGLRRPDGGSAKVVFHRKYLQYVN